jgi:hypothetical protein
MKLIDNLITAAPVLGILIGAFFGVLIVSGIIAVPVCNWMERKGWLK